MGRCEYCGKEVFMPFKCSYCGKIYCSEHHLPEKHHCAGLPERGWKAYKIQKHVVKPQKKKQPLVPSNRRYDTDILDSQVDRFSPIEKSNNKENKSKNHDSYNNNSEEWSYSDQKRYDMLTPKKTRGWIITVLVIVGLMGVLYVSDPDTFIVTINDAYKDIVIQITSLRVRISAPNIICSSFSTDPVEIWVGESFSIDYKLSNIGNKNFTWTIVSKIDDVILEKNLVYLGPDESNNYIHRISTKNPCTYNFTIDGLNTSFSQEIVVRFPKNVLERPDYYYLFAEKYVKDNYGLPKDHSVVSLFNLLMQVELPPYYEKDFDCSDSSTFIEWLLEGAGFTAYLQDNENHQWVQVETIDGLVAIEATNLCKDDNYDSPGIVDNLNGDYTEYTSEYLSFLQWKKDYPASKYKVDPNITFDEWVNEYLDKINSPGIPSITGYYCMTGRTNSPSELYEGELVNDVRVYTPIAELDWWNTEPFNQKEPFKYW